jgi:hypothetical protein
MTGEPDDTADHAAGRPAVDVERTDSVADVADVAAPGLTVRVGGDPFCAYLFGEDVPVLTKPVVYPLVAPGGRPVTRGYPLDPRPNERVDHPHHVGSWLAYGNVDGLDFWNNSPEVPDDRADEYGTIRHRDVERTASGRGTGQFTVTADWVTADGERRLAEESTFVIRAWSGDSGDGDGGGAGDTRPASSGARRVIDRRTTLTATDGAVALPDDKEGFLGLRVARELEHPTDEPVTLTDRHGETVEVDAGDDDVATGEYHSSEGVRGTDVWGTRARWVTLHGERDGPVSVTIMDHPDNVGYPTYWHARGYGLFAANPLGASVFTDGEERRDARLADGESLTVRYRIAVDAGRPTAEALDVRHESFVDAWD